MLSRIHGISDGQSNFNLILQNDKCSFNICCFVRWLRSSVKRARGESFFLKKRLII